MMANHISIKPALTAMFILFAVPGAALAQEAAKSKIHVVGNGTINVAPDMAIISMGVTKQADTARKALDANSKAMSDVLAAMKKTGIEVRDLQTSNFSIQPQYIYPKQNDGTQQPKIIGYIVRNNLTVRIRDLEAVGDVLDASVSLGVNDGGSLVFTNEDPKIAISQARSMAMKDAIEKAKTLTQAANVELADILEINEQTNRATPRPMARAQAMEMASDNAVPIASGENTYSISVNVTFEIEN